MLTQGRNEERRQNDGTEPLRCLGRGCCPVAADLSAYVKQSLIRIQVAPLEPAEFAGAQAREDRRREERSGPRRCLGEQLLNFLAVEDLEFLPPNARPLPTLQAA